MTEAYDMHISDLLASLYEAIEERRGWSLVRVGDGEQRVLAARGHRCDACGAMRSPADKPPWTHAEGGSVGTSTSLDWLQVHSMLAIRHANWVGWFANHETDQAALDARECWPPTERSQCAWVNLHLGIRRGFVERVLRRGSLFLVGEPMAQWREEVLLPLGLGENAEVYEGNASPNTWGQCGDVIAAIRESDKQIVLASLGIWALPVCLAAQECRKVAIDYGHAPAHTTPGHPLAYPLNTCCDDSPAGTMEHYAHTSPPQMLPEKGY